MKVFGWPRALALGVVFALLALPMPAGSAQATPQDVLIFGSTSDVETMDPQVTVDNIAWRAIYYSYDRLGQLQGGTPEVAPQLAESWTISPDGKTYTFRLRRGVKFVDGTPFDAKAVEFSFTRLLKMGKGAAGLWDGILDVNGITVVNASTIRFTLKTPFAPFLGSLATDQASIVSPGIMKYEKGGDLAQAWLAGNTGGTGPFFLKEWRRGERIVLERNPNYWGRRPALRQVIIRNIPDPAVLRDLLERGEVDMGEALTDDQLDAIKGKPGITVTVRANLADGGIKVKIEGFARPTMRAKLDKADFDMATGFWTPDYPDADMFTWFWFYSKNGGLAGNRSFYSNPRMDELVVAQRQETDPAKRLALFRQIQKIAVDEAVYVYLHQAVYRIPMRSRVQGYVYNPMLLFMPNFSGISKKP